MAHLGFCLCISLLWTVFSLPFFSWHLAGQPSLLGTERESKSLLLFLPGLHLAPPVYAVRNDGWGMCVFVHEPVVFRSVTAAVLGSIWLLCRQPFSEQNLREDRKGGRLDGEVFP